MRVLVTGATSLTGLRIVEKLKRRGDEVSTLQRGASGLGVEEHLGDIADPSIVAEAVESAQAVIHLAGLVSITGEWSLFEETNIRGTANLIDASLNSGVERFIHVSSPSVAHSGAPLVGATAGPADPESAVGHYARSKAEAELLALGADSPEMSVVAIRPHLIWGPGDKQLVGRIVERARCRRLAVIGSGAALIDTTYVDNAVDALLSALERAPMLGGRALVVTNGQPRPIREMLSRIVAAAGIEPPRFRVPYGAAQAAGFGFEKVWDITGSENEPPLTRFLANQLGTAHWFDQREARKALQWEPAVSLDEGFTRLREWFESET